MTELTAYTGARIFDGETWHDDAALVVDDDMIHSIGPVPAGARTVAIDRGLLVPGFIDLQVNGGGGHLVGPGTTVADLQLVCDTHAGYGVTALLPTLITDTAEVTDAVLAAGATAARQGLPGFLGLHLEGPHLASSRKGAHDPALIRPMEEADLVRLERARASLPHLLVTVATEACTPEQITRLVQAGITVSLGHSDASFEAASAAIRAGASMATHLFNAMSQIGNREPGLVGAVLHHGAVSAGLIADGIHIHQATLGIARRAKQGPGALFLVSDSMSQAGTDNTEFQLNGRIIYRREGALRLADGTLAGADLTMDRAVRNLAAAGTPLDTALKMASRIPATAIGAETRGRLLPGARADVVHLGPDLEVRAVWRGGRSGTSLR
jgi:N-acetylglucosamine-6-phosphate deacetylase